MKIPANRLEFFARRYNSGKLQFAESSRFRNSQQVWEWIGNCGRGLRLVCSGNPSRRRSALASRETALVGSHSQGASFRDNRHSVGHLGKEVSARITNDLDICRPTPASYPSTSLSVAGEEQKDGRSEKVWVELERT